MAKMAQPMLNMTNDDGRKGRWLRSLQALAGLSLAALVLGATGAAGCKSTPAFCVGGYVRTVDGKQSCEGLCDPAKCASPGNVCVNNLCALQCKGDADCALGESCLPATTDGPSGTGGTGGASAGVATTTCQNNGRSAIGAPCPTGNECATQQPSCPDGSSCDYTQCGFYSGADGSLIPATCSPDPVACGSSASCTVGTCSDGPTCTASKDCGAGQTCTDGHCSCATTTDCASGVCTNGVCTATPCTVPGCMATDCKPLVCVSAGVGDANAFCTLQDCASDANCPGGFFCGTVRDPHPLCGAAASKIPSLCGIPCTSAAQCTGAYGAGATCVSGSCQAACVMAGSGNTYTQGPYCTERKECLPRKPCSPCTKDVDCSHTPGMHCTAMGGSSFCSSDCGSDADCPGDFQCTSGECVPRAGSCTGTKAFCEPCHTDDECNAGLYCSGSDGYVCVLPPGSMSCTSSAGCPKSPSGLNGACLDEIEEVQPGDAAYHTCYLPFLAALDRFQCYANNQGASCGANTDCVSNKCVGADASTGTLGSCM